MAYNLTDETKPAKKRTNLTGLHIAELSIVDSPANVDSVITLAKRRADPQPAQPFSKGNAADQQTALDAMQRLLDKVQKAAEGPETMTLNEALSKACPTRQNAAADEVHVLAEQYADKNGCSYAQAYDNVAKCHPELIKRAIDGGGA